MASERGEILAGLAVLAIAAGFVFYAARTAGIETAGSGYPLKASFRSVDGITVGSDIRLAGLKIGTITDLSLNPATYFADATLSIRQDVAIPTDSAILISSEGLLGGNYVEIVPGGAVETLAAGEEIEDTQGSVSLVTLLLKFVGSGATETAPQE